jgi:hypothetical protein
MREQGKDRTFDPVSSCYSVAISVTDETKPERFTDVIRRKTGLLPLLVNNCTHHNVK